MGGMRTLLWTLLHYGGFHRLLRLRTRRTLTIVLYHGVGSTGGVGIYNYRGKIVSPETFARHLAYYAAHYTVLPLDEAVSRLMRGEPMPPYPLAITFDDGYRNNYTHAFPLLKSRNMPATVFLTTDFVDRNEPLWVDRLEYAIGTGSCEPDRVHKLARDAHERERLKRLPHDKRLRALAAIETACGTRLTDLTGERAVYAPLTWEEVREMAAHGIMFGAHTESHPILSTMPREDARAEVEGSLAVLRAHCGAVSTVFAYPNGQTGDVSDETRELVRAAGFSAALTTVPGRNTPTTDPWSLHRVTLDASGSFPFFTATVTGARHTITSFIKHHAKRSKFFQ